MTSRMKIGVFTIVEGVSIQHNYVYKLLVRGNIVE